MALSLFVVKSVLSSLACFSKPNKLMNAIITINMVALQSRRQRQRQRQGHLGRLFTFFLEEKSFLAGLLIY